MPKHKRVFFYRVEQPSFRLVKIGLPEFRRILMGLGHYPYPYKEGYKPIELPLNPVS